MVRSWVRNYLLSAFLCSFCCTFAGAQSVKQLFLKIQDFPRSRDSQAELNTDISPGVLGSIDIKGKGVGIFDNFYVENIRRMQQIANVGLRAYEYNTNEGEVAAQRALIMNSTNALHSNLMRSDLAGTYRSVLRTFADIKEAASFSVRKTGSGLSLSKKRPGKKILEFGVQPDVGLHLDPYVKAFEVTRFRYDTRNQNLLFEVKTSW